MKRRDFFKLTSAGALAPASVLGAAGGNDDSDQRRTPLPGTQHGPLPDLGSHWDLFQTLSTACSPAMSFLEDQFDDVREWSAQARSYLVEQFHYAPEPCDFEPEVLERVDRGSYERRRVLIQVAPGVRIPVYLLVPANLSRPAPAAVVLHDHGGFYFWGKEKVVHVEPEHPALAAFKQKYYDGRSIADELAKRGFVAIAPDMLHWGERGMVFDADPDRIKARTPAVTKEDIGQFNARSWAHEELVSRTALACGATWSGIIASDDRRVTDYLLTLPEVDRQRVGCVGLSLGSVRSIFLGAVHPRVRAAVAVCWMAEYQPMIRNHIRNGIGFTKLVPGLYGQLDWPDLAGLHLPGALMTVNGLRDTLYPLTAARAAVAKVAAIFKKAGAADQYEGTFFDGPHEFNRQMQERTFTWLAEKLAS